MSNSLFYKYDNAFPLEDGEILPGFTLAYQTFGALNKAKDNVIWVVHALTANTNPLEWWPGIVGDGCPINPKDHFIICANALGSYYGSTSPMHVNVDTGEPYYHDFPIITPRDMALSYDLLRKHLGIEKIKMLVGASMGGQQAMEWAILNSSAMDKLLLIATNAFHSPWGIAFSESQRLAITADCTWKNKSPDAGTNGLVAARSIALLSYRTAKGYNRKQEETESKIEDFKVCSYQRYQGLKLAKRFNAFSYWSMTRALDAHDVGRGRASREEALSMIKSNTTIIGITTDMLFPYEEQEYIHAHIKDSILIQIHSDLGHDGFLTESKQVGEIIASVLTKN